MKIFNDNNYNLKDEKIKNNISNKIGKDIKSYKDKHNDKEQINNILTSLSQTNNNNREKINETGPKKL